MFNSCKPSDAKLQQQVTTALSAVDSSVSAAVKGGVATLTGTVSSEDAKTAANTAVAAIKGIKSVTNNIEVELPVVINPDQTLTNVITSALIAAGFTGVKLAVDDGVVTLTGDAKKADLVKIMQIANDAKPKKVINNLNLKK